MSDEKKKEIQYHAPVVGFDNEHSVVTSIGFTAKAEEKFQIVWPVPTSDEDCQERYDCSLDTLIAAGVRQLSTRPDYKTVGFDDDGFLKDGGHEAMQTLADGYKVGARRVGGPTQKAKAADMDEIAAAAKGLSKAEIIALIQQAQGMTD
jgi:hypothetical protein